MSHNNYINLPDEMLDTPIYRIMPIHRFLQLLEGKKLTLVRPKKWDDPFENVLLNSSFQMSDGKTVTIAARDYVYGQCWTLHSETDAMWRIYSHNKDGVRVSTTPRKLLTALETIEPKFHNIKCFIGKVEYICEDQLEEKLRNVYLFDTNGSGIAESLLYKRVEFAHENEIRLIYSADESSANSDIFEFNVNPNELLDTVLFDPRMEKNLRQAYVLAINAIGCSAKIETSKLYDTPKIIKIDI